jgi:hypothetical protein
MGLRSYAILWLQRRRRFSYLALPPAIGFCLVNAFREPFMTGESVHSPGAALGLMLSTTGFAILKAMNLKDAAEWVFPSSW